MRPSLKRQLDWHVGVPLLNVLDLLGMMAGALPRRRRRDGPIRSVLVLKFQGMGSLAIAKPALQELRRQHPDAHIAFWGVASTCALARHMPEFDDIICLDDRSFLRATASALGCLLKIWRTGFDWVFDLEVYSKLSSVLATLTFARNRAGFAVALVRQRRHIHTHLVIFNTYEHLGLAYLKLFGQIFDRFDLEALSRQMSWQFPLDPLPELSRPYVVLNPHVGELCPERRWPRQHWQELAGHLAAARPELQVVLLGWSAAEKAANAEWPSMANVVDLSGSLPVPELVRCLAHACLVVSADSGPLQLALLTSAPVLGLFGPTRPQTYFPPQRPRAASLFLALYCSPCFHHWDVPPCAGDNQCVKAIPVEDVWAWCRHLLGDGEAPQAPTLELVDPSYYAGRIQG